MPTRMRSRKIGVGRRLAVETAWKNLSHEEREKFLATLSQDQKSVFLFFRSERGKGMTQKDAFKYLRLKSPAKVGALKRAAEFQLERELRKADLI